jgi:hypothetical protein
MQQNPPGTVIVSPNSYPTNDGVYRDAAIENGAGQFSAPLSARIKQTRTGTPLRGDVDGWVYARPGEAAECIAATFARGGETVRVWRMATVETYREQFKPGHRYAIIDVDDTGKLRFAPDPFGEVLGVTKTQYFHDLTRASRFAVTLPEPEPDSTVVE